jgi:hypothetical protein
MRKDDPTPQRPGAIFYPSYQHSLGNSSYIYHLGIYMTVVLGLKFGKSTGFTKLGTGHDMLRSVPRMSLLYYEVLQAWRCDRTKIYRRYQCLHKKPQQ